MTAPKIVCVVPSNRPDRLDAFRAKWAALFARHAVTLVTVEDGDDPSAAVDVTPTESRRLSWSQCEQSAERRGLFCRHTDACRNIGFLLAAQLAPDYVLTLDDDVHPPAGCVPDPIRDHIDALAKRVPLTWMNTAMHYGAEYAQGASAPHETLYLRGVPYGVRAEAPVMLSHGVWVNVPDFDGETQLRFERGAAARGAHPQADIPYTLPYVRGPVPRGVLFPLCGMNVMIRAAALPDFYFAPMGADSGFPALHRFADIFMGVFLKQQFDRRGWACYTGAATVVHTRASDAARNAEQETLGRHWLECLTTPQPGCPADLTRYLDAYHEKRTRYAALIARTLRTSDA